MIILFILSFIFQFQDGLNVKLHYNLKAGKVILKLVLFPLIDLGHFCLKSITESFQFFPSGINIIKIYLP